MAVVSVSDFGFIDKWIVPQFDNKHIMPYGTIRVMYVDDKLGNVVNTFKTHGDTLAENSPCQYIIIDNQRYEVVVEGSLYNPTILLRKWNKTNVDGKWRYL
jgi:hypothetical protein